MSPEPTDPLGEYLRVVETMPPLTPQEERRLWPSVKRNDDDLARKRLLEGSLHLVIPILLVCGSCIGDAYPRATCEDDGA